MDKNVPGRGAGQRVAPPPPPDKLADLLTSFSHLRRNHRALVQTLHGSIHELRELRSNLRKQHPTNEGARESMLAQRFGLTPREVQVAKLLAQGRSNQAIARELCISAHTARHHTQRVLGKLEVHSRGEAGAKIRSS